MGQERVREHGSYMGQEGVREHESYMGQELENMNAALDES